LEGGCPGNRELAFVLAAMEPMIPAVNTENQKIYLQPHVSIKFGLIKHNKEKKYINDASGPAPNIFFYGKIDRNKSGKDSQKFDVIHNYREKNLSSKSATETIYLDA
jgi:hypothetical protein